MPRLICPGSHSPVPQHLVVGWLVCFDPADRPTHLFFNQADMAGFLVFVCACVCAFLAPSLRQLQCKWAETWQLLFGGNTSGVQSWECKGSEQKRRVLFQGSTQEAAGAGARTRSRYAGRLVLGSCQGAAATARLSPATG